MSKAKAMTQADIRKQVKEGDAVIKQIILRNLRGEGFKVKPKTFVLSGRRFVKSIGVGKIFSLEYTVGVTNKMPGLSNIEVGGNIDILIDGLVSGEQIFTTKKCNVPMFSGYEVIANMGYHERNWK